MASPASNRFHLLIEAALAGRLTSTEHEELQQRLRESPELRKIYLESMRMQLDLDALSRQFAPPELPATPMSDQPLRTRRRPWRRWFAAGAAASVLGLGAWLGLSGRDHADQPVAQAPPAMPTEPQQVVQRAERPPIITETASARLFGEGIAPKPGDSLTLKREYVLTQGFLALEFADGARAVFRAPAVFSAVGEAVLQVRSGQCSVHAPPGAEGFQVLSPAAEVVDLGTRFVIDVTDTGETELLVVDGAATMASTQESSPPPMLLKEGESARVEPGLVPQPAAQQLKRRSYLQNLPDRVISYEATRTPDGYADELLSVSVQRGGKVIEYPRSQLRQGRVVHFLSTADTVNFCTRMGESLPEGKDRLALLNDDWSLVTGIVNPRNLDRSDIASTAVMTIEFDEPVVNGPGPDILLFDLQLLVAPPEGDQPRFRSGDPGFQKVWEAAQFDLDLTSPYALDLVPHRTYRSSEPTLNIEDLITKGFHHGRQVNVNAKGIVVGIDLSNLGYAKGESLTRLEILEGTTTRQQVDPVLIVGLPAVETDAN